MKRLPISPDMSVLDALDSGHSLQGVFLKHRTACVGCSLARFCTLGDVAGTYGFPLTLFLSELKQVDLADPLFSEGAPNEEHL